MNNAPQNPGSNQLGAGCDEAQVLGAVEKSGYPLQTIVAGILGAGCRIPSVFEGCGFRRYATDQPDELQPPKSSRRGVCPTRRIKPKLLGGPDEAHFPPNAASQVHWSRRSSCDPQRQ
jgi:hypothetical protein